MSYTKLQFEEARDPDNCDHCNYDTHRCHGCGEPLPHGVEVCEPCDEEFNGDDPVYDPEDDCCPVE